MSDKFDKKEEERLEQYLKANQPLAPEPKKGERDRIFAAISKDSEEKAVRWFPVFSPVKWAVPAMVAAAVVFVLWTGYYPFSNGPSDAAIAEFMNENFSTVYQLNGEQLNTFGQEWFELAESIK